MGWACCTQTLCGRREIHTGFWWGNLKEKDYLEDLGVGGRIEFK
jgi:hypothetical protein